MDFSLIDYLDEDACYTKLVELLHPDGLACPRCGERQRLGIHRRHRDPVLDYQCGACGRVFNAWTGTALQGTHRRPSQLLLILRGIAQGTPTAQMARELGCDRKQLLALRHRLQEHARRSAWTATRWATPWSRPTRCTRTRGKKGIPHDDPDDPPRRRANSRRGHGTFANDRPPIAGVVGRESGEVRLEVLEHGRAAVELEEVVDDDVPGGDDGQHRRVEGATTGSASGMAGSTGRWTTRGRSAPGRSDDDGDGVREVHCNTHGGAVDGGAELPAAVPGVSKWYLAQYVAVFQWGHNLKEVTDEFLRVLWGFPRAPDFALMSQKVKFLTVESRDGSLPDHPRPSVSNGGDSVPCSCTFA